MNSILSAKKIVKRYRNPSVFTILKEISLEVHPGESVAIMGKSGEGKTTLLHILGTLEAATEGSIKICGINASPENFYTLRNQKIGFIFQEYYLLDDYTVVENVLIPAKIGKQNVKPGSALYHRAIELLEEVGLSSKIDFPIQGLSGGEKQRVSIARALLNDPGLILADEPSGNLDQGNSKTIYNLLLEATNKRGKALVIVTHDHNLSLLCQKTYLLQEGQLI